MKTGAASSTAIGWMTSIVPTPVPTPRPLRNPTKTDQMAPATAATPHRTSISGSPPVTTRASRTGSGTLEQVAEDDEGRPLPAERPQGVRAAGPARADRPRIRAHPTAGPRGSPSGSIRRGRRRRSSRSSGSRDPSMRSCVGRSPEGRESSIRDRVAGPARRRLREPRRPAYHRRDDPTACPARRRLSAAAERQAPRGTLTHGRRLVQRFRSRRARRGHRRLHGGLPGRPARPEGRARRRGQDRRDVPPSWLHPDQGAARIGGLRRARPPRQGLRPGPAGRAGRSTTPRWRPVATRS